MPKSHEENIAEQREKVLSYVETLQEKDIYSPQACAQLGAVLKLAMSEVDLKTSAWSSTESEFIPNGTKLDEEMGQTDNHAWARLLPSALPSGNKQKSIQVSLSGPQKLLLEKWSEAEGKSLSGVAAEALSVGLAQLRKDKTIPEGAVAKYQTACDVRLACVDITQLIIRDFPIDQDFEP